MLSVRIATAVLLLLPLLAVLFYLSSVWTAAVFGLAVGLGAWEWTALIGWQRVSARLGYTVALLVTGAALIVFSHGLATATFVVALLGWIAALVELARGGKVHEGWLDGGIGRGAAGFVILIPAWVATYTLHAGDPQSPLALLFALVLVWVADTMAYFVGHRFGRTKLAPTVSPGKTVEGVAGGIVGVALVAAFSGRLIWSYEGGKLALWIGLSIVAGLFSVLGDLLESRFKRVAGVKDSGRILPGHGGVLDRIDGLTSALPVFALGWHLWFRPA